MALLQRQIQMFQHYLIIESVKEHNHCSCYESSRDSSAALLHFKSNLHGSFVTINECCKIQDNFTKVQIVSVERLLLIQARPGKISLNLLGIPIFSSKTRRGTFPTVQKSRQTSGSNVMPLSQGFAGSTWTWTCLSNNVGVLVPKSHPLNPGLDPVASRKGSVENSRL